MDEGVKALLSRKFKLYLKKQTSHKLRAAATGTFFSAILQSSSIVNLLVLSLAGAGVLQLSNALALVLGSNLGTVGTNWLLALFGFSYGIDMVAFPLAAISGITQVFLPAHSKLYSWARLVLGLSFLFISLGFIKEGMTEIMKDYDISVLSKYPAVVFAIVGFLITSIVQSSSATMALALSALFVNAISLNDAMAVSLGAETGSAVKLFLASAKGNTVKKSIALSNFMFNVITMIIFLFLLQPLNSLITGTFSVDNKLIALVLFQTIVNISCIILFLPFVDKIAKWMEKIYKGKSIISLRLHKANPSERKPALEAMEEDTKAFMGLVFHFCESAVHIEHHEESGELAKQLSSKPMNEKYVMLKHIHGELHNFYVEIRHKSLNTQDIERLERLMGCSRNALYAAKSIKDGMEDIEQLSKSSNDLKYNYYVQSKNSIADFTAEARKILLNPVQEEDFEAITSLLKNVQSGYQLAVKELYSPGFAEQLNDEELSTLFNFNRETYTAFKSILFALKDLLLNDEEARQFDEMPGFIR